MDRLELKGCCSDPPIRLDVERLNLATLQEGGLMKFEG